MAREANLYKKKSSSWIDWEDASAMPGLGPGWWVRTTYSGSRGGARHPIKTYYAPGGGKGIRSLKKAKEHAAQVGQKKKKTREYFFQED